jgi:hypothetical protein
LKCPRGFPGEGGKSEIRNPNQIQNDGNSEVKETETGRCTADCE